MIYIPVGRFWVSLWVCATHERDAAARHRYGLLRGYHCAARPVPDIHSHCGENNVEQILFRLILFIRLQRCSTNLAKYRYCPPPFILRGPLQPHFSLTTTFFCDFPIDTNIFEKWSYLYCCRLCACGVLPWG